MEQVVNDIHSQLNPTKVNKIIPVDSLTAIRQAIEEAGRQNKAISIAGKRHAMGGQQFGADTILLDTTPLHRLIGFADEQGILEVEAGIQWPELIQASIEAQPRRVRAWGIAQKQTGADNLTLGGTLAANGHGRGLSMRPIIADVESFLLVDAFGQIQRCSRQQNSQLFQLAIGGYGLFGVIYSVKLRLAPWHKVERVAEVMTIDRLLPAFEQRLAAGFLYGDFQFSTDEQSDNFLREGILACYRPVRLDTPLPPNQQELSLADWQELFYLAHADKAEAYRRYVGHYLQTSGQIYESDTHQLSVYLDNYHRDLDKRMGAAQPATEVITEVYTPREALPDFMAAARDDFIAHGVNLIYGTIRLIEPDDESFLAWAKQPFACIVFNLHTLHTPEGIAHSTAAFRRLIDLAIARGGSYFLTYHKYATRRQVETCYPQLPEFLRLKLQYDPEERFQSNWYRHYKQMFADAL